MATDAMPISLKRFQKYFMITMPMIFFAAGSHCLYDSYCIFKTHQQQKEIGDLLDQTGIFAQDRTY